MNHSLFVTTSHQKVLAFLAQHAGESFYDAEIARSTGLSRGAANAALRELARCDFISRDKKGRMVFCQIKTDNAVVRQFKVYLNILNLDSLLTSLKEHALKIVLFGSASQGTDTAQSDFDIFILTNESGWVKRFVEKIKTPRKIQAVTQGLTEWTQTQRKEPTFADEVNRGIVLWEGK